MGEQRKEEERHHELGVSSCITRGKSEPGQLRSTQRSKRKKEELTHDRGCDDDQRLVLPDRLPRSMRGLDRSSKELPRSDVLSGRGDRSRIETVQG